MTVQQQAMLNDIVWSTPIGSADNLSFKGTRVPIQALIDHFEDNGTLGESLTGFPSVTREQAIRFIELAKENLLSPLSS